MLVSLSIALIEMQHENVVLDTQPSTSRETYDADLRTRPDEESKGRSLRSSERDRGVQKFKGGGVQVI